MRSTPAIESVSPNATQFALYRLKAIRFRTNKEWRSNQPLIDQARRITMEQLGLGLARFWGILIAMAVAEGAQS